MNFHSFDFSKPNELKVKQMQRTNNFFVKMSPYVAVDVLFKFGMTFNTSIDPAR